MSHSCELREGNGTFLGGASAGGDLDIGTLDTLTFTGGTVVPVGTNFKDIQVWCRAGHRNVTYGGVSLMIIRIGGFF